MTTPDVPPQSAPGVPSPLGSPGSDDRPGNDDEALTGLWSRGIGRAGTRAVQWLAILTLVAICGFLVANLTMVVIPVLVALVLASAISPFVVWLRARGMGPLLATWTALLALIAALAVVVWGVIQTVARQWSELVDSAVEGLGELQGTLEGLPVEISAEELSSLQSSLMGLLSSDAFSSGLMAGVSATANFLTGTVIAFVVLFFFLKDGPRIWEFLLRPFHDVGYERGHRVGHSTVWTLGGYVRGTAIVAAIDAVGIGIGLAIMGVPLALPLAVMTFLLAFIPLVGATLAGVLAALVALVTNGLGAALIVVAIVVGVQQFEGNFLQPVIMARTLKLHPLVILLALTAGTVTAGIAGAVLAVPITAAVWSAVCVWDGPATPARFARPKIHPEKAPARDDDGPESLPDPGPSPAQEAAG